MREAIECPTPGVQLTDDVLVAMLAENGQNGATFGVHTDNTKHDRGPIGGGR